MRFINILILILLAGILSSCWIEAAEDSPNGPGEPDPTPYENVSNSNLPTSSLSGNSMDALPVDIDNDGDMDLIVAIEFGPNQVLLNNSSGTFSLLAAGRLPARNFDTQGIAVADFNQDGLFDIFFASAEDQTNEFYINSGGNSFFDATVNRIPVTGISNAVVAANLDGGGGIDLLIGNSGQNVVLINNGNAFFSNQSGQRLPQRQDITQDIEVADIDDDGDPDIIVANEDNDNRILINTGSGFYNDQTSSRLPLIGGIEETRDIDLADIDGDGDLDIYFSNVQLFESGANPQDRLLVNDGDGVFSDVTSSQLPEITTNTFDTDFFDIDDDGDLDIITGNYDGGIRVFINDGSGTFTDETEDWMPEDFNPRVIDFEIADYNGDELPDIYIAVYDGTDALLLRKDQQ